MWSTIQWLIEAARNDFLDCVHWFFPRSGLGIASTSVPTIRDGLIPTFSSREIENLKFYDPAAGLMKMHLHAANVTMIQTQ